MSPSIKRQLLDIWNFIDGRVYIEWFICCWSIHFGNAISTKHIEKKTSCTSIENVSYTSFAHTITTYTSLFDTLWLSDSCTMQTPAIGEIRNSRIHSHQLDKSSWYWIFIAIAGNIERLMRCAFAQPSCVYGMRCRVLQSVLTKYEMVYKLCRASERNRNDAVALIWCIKCHLFDFKLHFGTHSVVGWQQ